MLEIFDSIANAVILVITAILFSMILLEKRKLPITRNKIIILIVGILIYSILLYYIEGIVKTLCLCCLYFIIFKQIFKISYSEAIFLSFLYVILIIVPDIILILFITISESAQIFYSQYAGTVLTTLIVNILFIIITYIFKKWLRKLFKIKLNNNKKIVLYTILTLGCVLIIFYKAFENVKINLELIMSLVVMVVFVIILFSLIKQKMENDKVVERYDKLLEFIKKYEEIIEEERELRHESKNQLITVKSKVLNKEDGKEIIKYVDSLLKDHKGYKEDKYGKFQYLPANGIKGLFYYKAMEAEERGIQLSINVGKRVANSILSKLQTEDFKQLGRILGVYLDNAIEASAISEDKKLGIEVYIHKEEVIIIISNTYNGEIDEESVGKIRYSTKGNNRGYGLMLVNKILNKNNRFIAERIINDKLYIQKLRIKKSI